MKRLFLLLALTLALAGPATAYTGNETPGSPDWRPIGLWLVRALILREVDLGPIVLHYALTHEPLVTATDKTWGRLYP